MASLILVHEWCQYNLNGWLQAELKLRQRPRTASEHKEDEQDPLRGPESPGAVQFPPSPSPGRRIMQSRATSASSVATLDTNLLSAHPSRPSECFAAV